MSFIESSGVDHLLVDLPSVDKEQDGGALLSHKTFWNINTGPDLNKTITEMIYVDKEHEDGLYLLNLQVLSLESDASPSRPILYKLREIEVFE